MNITPNELNIIQMAIDILDKHFCNKEVTFSEPSLVRAYLRLNLGALEREHFDCLYLDNQNRLICKETLFMGGINSCTVLPRVVVQNALKHNAASVIFAHNHPSGEAEPSRADRAITERLVQALDLVDVRVLDHFVVGNPDVVSFAERGWL